MKNSVLLILLVVSFFLNLTFTSLVAFKQCSRPDRETAAYNDFVKPPPAPKAKKFKFPPQKLKEFENLKEEIKKERQEAKKHIKKLKMELFDEIYRDDPDMDKIFQLIDGISDQQKIIQKSIVKKVLFQRKSLSPEERVKFDKVIKKRLMKHLGSGQGPAKKQGFGRGPGPESAPAPGQNQKEDAGE